VTVVDPSTPPSAEPSNLEGAPAAPSELDHGSHDDQDNDKVKRYYYMSCACGEYRNRQYNHVVINNDKVRRILL